ncbi:AAA family ATPase [Mycobacterium sp. smrl_JER01]|uniref:AAA family ATPase n=1 Tax=Mycobacterium sp. smrl_JER01 TaxID=3402633 RepID=UPI003ACC04EB
MAAVTVCGSCGNGLRDTAKFCDECGAPMSAAPEASGYKQVTVLFADVVRSMHMAATLDLERFRAVMTDLVETAAAVLRSYGGTVAHTGDGVMGLFGAPIAMEDHAFRGCLAALALQAEVQRLAASVERSDNVLLQVRVGLNSGRVIAGEIGSGSLGYTATGAAVGFAQRLESIAPPGAVMVSESTAQLTEDRVVLSDPESVRVRGFDEPVCARRLLSIRGRSSVMTSTEAGLVGRHREMAVLGTLVECSLTGHGAIGNVVGPPGIGKSRVVREAAAPAADRGIGVIWIFCESHARDIAFGAVVQLLRAVTGVTDLDDRSARARIRDKFPRSDEQDLLLLDELLGIADPTAPRPQIDPDARRRRLTALVNAATSARTQPLLVILEDAHWIDAVSESMITDFLTVTPGSPTTVLITSRPEYGGPLRHGHGARELVLAPLADSDIADLLEDLLGSDASLGELPAVVADRARGNPFFAEEMVRELVQRGVLTGARGNYVCDTDAAEVHVPATVQAAIEARMDRLSPSARRTLNAASVIGDRFGTDMLTALGIEPAVDELLGVDLIDQIRFTPPAQYAFRHPLIRAVAYESQLKTTRAEVHRRLAAVIAGAATSEDEHAAAIAEHLHAAGDLREAFGWHMRAATWSTSRDIAAARGNWERAKDIADRLAGDDVGQIAMRIAPRTMLCVTDWQARPVQKVWGRFTELRRLCARADDKVSLAIGMTGLATELLYAGRPGEGARLASEQMALLESIGDPTLTAGLSFVAFANWFNSGDFGQILAWSQRVVELTGGDPAMGGDFGVGSPLAVALTFRGIARWWLGHTGWRDDLDEAAAIALRSDPTTRALVIAWAQLSLIYGVSLADESVVRTVEEAARIAEICSNDFAVMGTQFTLGVTLLHRESEAERQRGLELMVRARDEFLPMRAPSLVPLTEVFIAREVARSGDRDPAITVMRRAVDELHRARRFGWAVCASDILVQTLLERNDTADPAAAQVEIDRLAMMATGADSVVLELTVLRLRALMAGTHGDDLTHRDLVRRYRTLATTHGYDGHIACADALQRRCPSDP